MFIPLTHSLNVYFDFLTFIYILYSIQLIFYILYIHIHYYIYNHLHILQINIILTYIIITPSSPLPFPFFRIVNRFKYINTYAYMQIQCYYRLYICIIYYILVTIYYVIQVYVFINLLHPALQLYTLYSNPYTLLAYSVHITLTFLLTSHLFTVSFVYTIYTCIQYIPNTLHIILSPPHRILHSLVYATTPLYNPTL